MYYDLVTAPTSEPVSIAEAKEHLLIESDNTDFDSYIAVLIKAARKFIEKRTGYIVNSVFALYLDEWPSDDFVYINRKPVSAITKVEYLPPSGTSFTELSTLAYNASGKHNPPVVYLREKPGLADSVNAVKITFSAGHDVAKSTDPVPEYIIQAIKILMRQMYENRQEEVTGTIVSKLDKGFEYLLQMAEVPSL
jgi:uncharacterized phiE125 gp8 family phage protein